MIDLFNPSFLVFLGVLVLVVSVLVVYFESKFREQNHKIASMFSIVSTLAEDLDSVKVGIHHVAFNGGGFSLAENIQEQNNLIEVSDDDEDEEELDEDELDEDSDDDSDELDEEEDDDSDDEPNVKVLKISDPLLEKVEQNLENLDVDDLDVDDLDDLDDLDNLEEDLDSEYDQENFEEEPLQLVESGFDSKEIVQINKNEKSIKIDLGDNVNETIDYKKLTLQKLKSIVTEKGLAIDTSKLKKHDLLKLLGIE